VAASTWNRELALVNGFFAWAAGQQLMPVNPVPQRARRAAAAGHRHGDGGALVPAAQARDTGRDEVGWLTPAEYRQWRDTGLRGYRPDGLPDAGIARQLVVSEAAVGKHVGNILAKLRLPQTDDTNRRVLAVLAYLRGGNQGR
jgi:hypothetical protein